MGKCERTRELILEHYRKYPRLQIQDIFKFLYQSSFGCEHLVSELDTVTDNIQKEYENKKAQGGELFDELDGEYCRVHLCALDRGLSAKTLGKLFCASAKDTGGGTSELERKLTVARELVYSGDILLDPCEFDSEACEWRASGYVALHHSLEFCECYAPSYRVISSRYVPYLQLFSKIDTRLSEGELTLAIDGGSASGKTTLSEMLGELYDSNVFHMDDFFLRPEQRTAERYAEVGGNVDRERFLDEVLIPLKRKQSVGYRRFDCSTMTVTPAVEIAPRRLAVIEGAYSMHPELSLYYDLSVFLDISAELQRKRIEKRNTPNMARRFFDEWIPLEKVYFSQMMVAERCDMVIEV